MTRHLDVPQLAERWHVSVKAVYGMRHRGELPPALKIGRGLLWLEESIEAFELERMEGAATKITTRIATRIAQPRDYSAWFKERSA